MSEKRKGIQVFKVIGLCLLLSVLAYAVVLKVKGARYDELKAEWTLTVEQLVKDKATKEQVIVEFERRGVEPYTTDADPGFGEKVFVHARIDNALTIFPFDQSLVPRVYFDDQGIAVSAEVDTWSYGITGL